MPGPVGDQVIPQAFARHYLAGRPLAAADASTLHEAILKHCVVFVGAGFAGLQLAQDRRVPIARSR